jgi:hypothetical protein
MFKFYFVPTKQKTFAANDPSRYLEFQTFYRKLVITTRKQSQNISL